MRKLTLLLLSFVAIASSNIYAQFTPGQVLGAAQLNAALASPTITGGSINGAPIGQSNPKAVDATSVGVVGATSGTVSILPQSAAGTYNFNLPTTAGASGSVLTSAAGGSSPMTWTPQASLAVGSATTATSVTTTLKTDNTTYYPLLGATAATSTQTVDVASGLSYNPTTGLSTNGVITSTVTGGGASPVIAANSAGTNSIRLLSSSTAGGLFLAGIESSVGNDITSPNPYESVIRFGSGKGFSVGDGASVYARVTNARAAVAVPLDLALGVSNTYNAGVTKWSYFGTAANTYYTGTTGLYINNQADTKNIVTVFDAAPSNSMVLDNVTGASFAGGINNTTVGALTPAAGSFTTLSASENALISGGIRVDPSSGATKLWLYRDTSAADIFNLGSNWVGSQENASYPSWLATFDSRVAGDTFKIRRAPAGGAVADIAAFSSTGLAVTGAVSANSGTISASSSNSVIFDIENTYTGAKKWTFYSSGGGPAPAGTFGLYNSTDGVNALTYTHGSGLAVTGALSATGTISPSNTESVRVLSGNEISFGNDSANLGIGQYFSPGADSLFWYNRTGGANLLTINRATGKITAENALASLGQLSTSATTDSTSSTTGALITAGGLGVAKKAYFGDTVSVGSGATTTAGLKIVSGSSGAASGYGWIYPENVTPSSVNYGFFSKADGTISGINGTTSANLQVNNVLVATATSTGLAVTGALSSTSASTTQYASAASGEATFRVDNTDTGVASRGALQVKTGNSSNIWQFFARGGDAFIGQSEVIDSIKFLATTGQVNVVSETDSTSSTTGALTINGGLGVAKKLYVGDIITISGIADPYLRIASSGGKTYDLHSSSGTAFNITDVTAGVTRLAIDTNGNATFKGGSNHTYVRVDNTTATTYESGYQFADNGTLKFTMYKGAGNNTVSIFAHATGIIPISFYDSGSIGLTKTITTPGTTGAQTINKTTGRVNFAAAATSLVVTNSLVDANSVCHVTIATNDATAANAKCVSASGSFTIYLGVAPTAETAVNFTVTN